jgi:ketosteroid isomerase-like protein
MVAAEVASVVEAFTDATNSHDVERMLELVSDDVVFEGTTPPDGLRIVGDKAALRELWEGIFRDSPRAVVAIEEVIVSGDRCTVRLRYIFDRDRPQDGHVRGVDVMRLDDGRIAEKLSYVKG